MAPNRTTRPRRRIGMFGGRSVVVTGASGGIGRDLSMTFASEGANVALLSRSEHVLSRLADRIARFGGSAMPVVCDVTEPEQVKRSIRQVVEEFGSIDILVNNAGVLIPGRFCRAKLKDLRLMMDVNFFGAVHATQAVLPGMRERGRGNVVNIASIAGRRGGVSLSGYSASKFALIGFTEALRAELYGTGVTASLVVPGPVDTPMLENPEWEESSWTFGDLKMPPAWVTWGVLAAVTLGLAEVEVPPGIVTAQKIATLFPDLTAGLVGFGTTAVDLLNSLIAGSVPRF